MVIQHEDGGPLLRDTAQGLHSREHKKAGVGDDGSLPTVVIDGGPKGRLTVNRKDLPEWIEKGYSEVE